ncbi:MAG: DEAD/DEAH box helicase family protein [Alphaproteobacteria bacterium]
MKLRFKVQPYQTDAVDAVVDCFAGQPPGGGLRYRIDPGAGPQPDAFDEGFRNADIRLPYGVLLDNIQKVQKRRNLPVSKSLDDFTEVDRKGQVKAKPKTYRPGARLNLDIEMETGTGKTYCYIKTIFEMNKRYGWSKFIVMVPSIAIREGVAKSFQITADHFTESYGRKARFFVYNSKRLHELESFSSDAGINVMIINIQAFNARGADNRRIYEELDDFQTRRPIDVISSNRPILILDEPQKMEGAATLDALPKFNPLMILRYSGTHRTSHLKVHRLDALDAFNQKLVKKIAVRGIQTRGLAGTNAYLYLEGIEISTKAPVARIEMEVKLKSGEIRRRLKRLEFGRDLYTASGELDQYRGFTISQIDYTQDLVEFTNGTVLHAGEATGDVNENDIRRIQIREAIKAHLDKERQLFAQGIKVLSLFFIDEVVKYRDYDRDDTNGDYARVFEDEYTRLKDEYLSELPLEDAAYRTYLAGIGAAATHAGYFSIDRKTKRLQDPKAKKTGDDAGLSDDVDAYDLILKDKERLLSFAEPTRFLFSHSALREGWDNPNVFVMCMLKHSDNTISRRQEVGRGLRLAVNQHGERIDRPAIVHDVNVLTVVASESYSDFVAGLQTEIAESLSARPRKATEEFFTAKVLMTDDGPVEVTPQMAKQIYRYLLKNDYTDDSDSITDAYHAAKEAGALAELPDGLKPYAEQIVELIDSVFDDSNLPKIDDGRKPKTNPLNDNFSKKEFQDLWNRINRRAVYRVDFDSAELVEKAIDALNRDLNVTALSYTVQSGEQTAEVSSDRLSAGQGFTLRQSRTEYDSGPAQSNVRYDLIGKIAENVHLTRRTVAEILTGIEAAVFAQFGTNPEHFISEAARLIKEQKATAIVERLSYDVVDDRYDTSIFTAAQTGQDFSRATEKLKNHIYDYCITDSRVEHGFVEDLDTSGEVAVYAKLPRGFLIPTPLGDYNPDWAISLTHAGGKDIFFVAETKGSMSSMTLRAIEQKKIDCARKFFAELNRRIDTQKVRYNVITDYRKLIDLISPPA